MRRFHTVRFSNKNNKQTNKAKTIRLEIIYFNVEPKCPNATINLNNLIVSYKKLNK